MAILTISEASRRWRLGRSNLYRAIKSGRLNLSARPDGSRGIDTSELVRVFGEPSERTTANMSGLSGEQVEGQEADDREHLRTLVQDDREQARTFSPGRLLQAQVDQLTAQLEQSQQEKTRLLGMLETEQQARRELETKLLPAPIKPAPSNHRLWVLISLLLAVLVLAIWPWRELITPYF
ncbi:MAG: hypothetical protein IPN66_07260 [Candidatus Competibacteraceae bacterium]|nr:hypothetical protein [Candidatus Competibacteraceae bacterium]MBK8897015.1 hypothetical protein [Candidatus Competibacteraceae bacterium]